MSKNYIVSGNIYRSTKGSAAYDIMMPDDIIIKPDEVRLLETHVAVSIREGCFGQLTARSSLFQNTGCILLNSPAIIDSDYNGEEDSIKIHIKNMSNKSVEIKAGERLAQLVIIPFEKFVNEVEPTKERKGGLGSTGK